eukprot:6011090-Pyramimonas_sp.AAC.1
MSTPSVVQRRMRQSLELSELQCIMTVVRRRIGLVCIAVPRSDNNATPARIVPRDRERAVPASPVILRSSGAMIVNQISFVIPHCMPGGPSVHESDRMFLSAARGPEQAGRATSLVAVQTGLCLETPRYRW